MRIFFWVAGVFCLIGAALTDQQAKSAIHQILAQIGYLIATVLIVGAEIIGAVSGTGDRIVAVLKGERTTSTGVPTSVDLDAVFDSKFGKKGESDAATSDAPIISQKLKILRAAGYKIDRGAYSGWKVTNSSGDAVNIPTDAALMKLADDIGGPKRV